MSGGVDSSVAAFQLKKEGFEVIGATMKLFCYGESAVSSKSCCSLEAINDAKTVCDKLGVPHYVISYEKEFEKEIIEDFISEYQKGRTPNPCIRCNQLIKFDYLLNKAKELGCDFLATGHYARIEEKKGQFSLLKGIDEQKDQTYFLYRLDQNQLSKLKFPLGGLTKKEVRNIAKEAGLKTAEKAESQEICFIAKDVPTFLRERIRAKRGDILDQNGKKIGEHEGVVFYTIGQRKGLGGGFKTPMYVTDIDVSKNIIVVGGKKDLEKKEVVFNDATWISGEMPGNQNLMAVIRYNMPEKKVSRIKKEGNQYLALFSETIRAVTPGQSIVFYKKDECLGGGIITK